MISHLDKTYIAKNFSGYNVGKKNNIKSEYSKSDFFIINNGKRKISELILNQDAIKHKNIIIELSLLFSDDPRVLLGRIRRHIIKNDGYLKIINNLKYNQSNVKSRTKELVRYLELNGFVFKKKISNILYFSSNIKIYNKMLRACKLPNGNKNLIITSEHADAPSTGGIGSYVKEVENTLGVLNLPLILYCGAEPITEKKNKNLIDIRDIIEDFDPNLHDMSPAGVSYKVLDSVLMLLNAYPEIDMIEYQEYQGIGARLGSAKKSLILPDDILLRVRCHGSQMYLANARRDWLNMATQEVNILEKESIEKADHVSFPTNFLKNLYIEMGYKISKTNCFVERLPYSYDDYIVDFSKEKIDSIVFLGKRGPMKGYPEFCRIISGLLDNYKDLATNIKNIYVFGNDGENCRYFDEMLSDVSKKYNIKLQLGPLKRSLLMTKIQELSTHSLFILPYIADNHPVTVLEMISNGSNFLSFNTGGVPELIPYEFRSTYLSEFSENMFIDKVVELFNKTTQERTEISRKAYDVCYKNQLKINQEVKDYYNNKRDFIKKLQVPEASEATIIVPIYNIKLKYIKDLLSSLNEQILPPEKIIFINDGSEKSYSNKLFKLIARECFFNYELIEQDNLGLAGARNTALNKVATKYLINIDSDDIVLPNFIFDYVLTMENNPEVDIAICALETIEENCSNWRTRSAITRYTYSGIGGSLPLSLIKNTFGHASCIVKTSVAKSIGGWDDKDRSKWEDWAFYLKAYLDNKNIINIPKINYLYRVREDSMVRESVKYPDYLAEKRLARNISTLSKWDANNMYGVIHSDFYGNNYTGETAEYQTTVRYAIKLSKYLDKAPIIKRTLYIAIKAVWIVYKKF